MAGDAFSGFGGFLFKFAIGAMLVCLAIPFGILFLVCWLLSRWLGGGGKDDVEI